MSAHGFVSFFLADKQQRVVASTNDELIGQAAVLFAAAHLTTANTLTWTLFLLAQHPVH